MSVFARTRWPLPDGTLGDLIVVAFFLIFCVVVTFALIQRFR